MTAGGQGMVCENCGRAPSAIENGGRFDQPGSYASPCAGRFTEDGCQGGEPIAVHDHECGQWWCGPCWDDFASAVGEHAAGYDAYDVVHVGPISGGVG